MLKKIYFFYLTKTGEAFYTVRRGFVMTKKERRIAPIAHIRTDFKEKFGIPRQSGRAPSLTARIVFEPAYRNRAALKEIERFSHLWLIFDFSKVEETPFVPTVRPPRLGGNKRVGVFASRSPFRPNRLGLSCVKLVGIERTKTEGDVLVVSGADLLDNTPIFDVKPYLPYADAIPNAVGGYADEHTEDRLLVDFPQALLLKIPEEKRAGILECLTDDPRPSYQEDGTRIYGMQFAGLEIKFRVEHKKLTVLEVTENV